jgi:iron complex outermembrane receptor protein
LNLDAQYLGAVYTQFTYQVPAGGTNAPPVTSCPFAQTDATHYTVNCAGKTPQQAPKWAGRIGVQQRAEIGSYTLTGEINAHGQSDSIIGFELLPVEIQKAYAQEDLSLGLSPSSARWSVVAFVNNVTDKRPYGASYYNSVNGLISSSIGPARTAGVRAEMKF